MQTYRIGPERWLLLTWRAKSFAYRVRQHRDCFCKYRLCIAGLLETGSLKPNVFALRASLASQRYQLASSLQFPWFKKATHNWTPHKLSDEVTTRDESKWAVPSQQGTTSQTAPASSSKRAAAIQPGAWLGLVEITDFNKVLAFFMSAISASLCS